MARFLTWWYRVNKKQHCTALLLALLTSWIVMWLLAKWLTCTLLDKGVVVVEATARANGDVVEATRHQRVEDTLRAGLGHGHSMQRPVSVTQRHKVAVNVAGGWPPRYTEEVRLTIVADRHLTHCGRDWVGTRGGIKQRSIFLASYVQLFVLGCLWTILSGR